MKKIDEATSKNIGRFVGPVTVLLLLSEIINFHIWNNGNTPQMVYLNGFVLLLFGFYIIRTHNLWIRNWQVLITLTGWFFTILGLYRMFFPGAQQASESQATYVGLVILLAIEALVTFKSYWPRK